MGHIFWNMGCNSKCVENGNVSSFFNLFSFYNIIISNIYITNMPGLIKSSFCYEYTYPVGMVNSLISFFGYDFCSEDTNVSEPCDEVSNCNDLNQAIARILQQHITINDVSQSSSQTIDPGPPLVDPITKVPNYPQMLAFIDQHQDLYKTTDGYKEFGCTPDEIQISSQISSSSDQITDSQATDILNNINSKVDEHLSQKGFSESMVLASAKNRVDNHSALLTHIKTKTSSIIKQNMNAREKITYIDNYQKCGLKDGKPIGNRITQEIKMESISKNIVKSTIQQMMKNDDTLKISSNVRVTKTEDRIVFFSFLISIIFVAITYSLFVDGPGLAIALTIYLGILVFIFGILYMEKK